MTSWPSEIDMVFLLVHKEKEKDRFERLIPHFLSRGVPPEKLACVAPTWGSDLTTEQIFQVYDPYCRQGIPVFTFKARCLSKGEISLVLNFALAARVAVEKGFQRVLIFESDTWLREDFVERLHDLLHDLKGKEWDYVSLGEGARTRPEKCDPSMFAKTKAYTPPHQFVFRCTDSMMFQVSYLQKILSTLFPFRECLDWELNIQTMAHKGKTWWADPPLAEQGTAVGRQETFLVA
jgi:GR25 family glycosyltransferase involved in LPS biosynthesis